MEHGALKTKGQTYVLYYNSLQLIKKNFRPLSSNNFVQSVPTGTTYWFNIHIDHILDCPRVKFALQNSY